MTHVTRPIPDHMLGRHEAPEGADESWQESWGFVWHDPLRAAGGIYHLSISRLRGVADVYNWVAYDGKVVGKYQNLNLAPPEQDYPDWVAGGMSITTRSARECRVVSTFEDVDVKLDLDYRAFTDPVTFSLDLGDATWGKDHYETVGRADGTVTIDGDALPVSGFAWQDHSWGPRRMADLLTHRWILAGFGPDLFMSALQIVTPAGPDLVPMGFIYDHGEVHEPVAMTYEARQADDGHTPLGCDARIWTKAGHGYHVTGTVRGASPSSQLEGFWCTDGLATFECGGRLGAGILETQELRGPAPWHRAVLGLDLPDALPEHAVAGG